MKEEIKEIWIEALTSGEYNKGCSMLRYKNEHCCLGVLCDIYHQKTGKGNWVKKFKGERPTGFTTDSDRKLGSGYVLPDEVRVWAGMKTSRGNIPSIFGIALTTINDQTRYNDFREVVDAIEKHWEEL